MNVNASKQLELRLAWNIKLTLLLIDNLLFSHILFTRISLNHFKQERICLGYVKMLEHNVYIKHANAYGINGS